MSAMHWEARRRQSALERRMARNKQQLVQGNPEPICDAESNTSQQQTVCGQLVEIELRQEKTGGQCPHCKGDLKTPVHRSARIPKRYSSLQYTQQW